MYELRIPRLQKDNVMDILHASAMENIQLEPHIQPLVDGIEIVEERIENLFEEFMDLVTQISETECDIPS